MIVTNKKVKIIIAGLVAMSSLLTAGIVNADTYRVKAGDTLSQIALANQTSVESLVSLNKIANPNVIYVNQVLELHKVTGATTNVSLPENDKSLVEENSSVPAEPIQETPVSYTSTVVGDEADAKEWIAQKESGGSYTAQNGIYYGRYQLTNSYLNGDYSPENQERVADAYVASRYGSWVAAKGFWLANGWY